jgi:FMN phosphatase YigB (HAD superfamily)
MSEGVGAVLFDIGGPLDREVLHEQLVDRDIVAALADEGFLVPPEAYAMAAERAVSSYAPDAYAAIAFELTGRDPEAARRVTARVQAGGRARFAERDGFELRPGLEPMLARLQGRGLALGLAANQPDYAVDWLMAQPIGRFFANCGASEHYGLRKPDPRFLLRCCEGLGVEPERCVMVGDRIDNDVAPAKLLGMKAVLFRTGRHAGQLPRSADEVPDKTVTDVDGLEGAIIELAGRR